MKKYTIQELARLLEIQIKGDEILSNLYGISVMQCIIESTIRRYINTMPIWRKILFLFGKR